jgi:phosphatidylserine decarboxylase
VTVADHLFVWLQYALPKRLITALVYRIARVEHAGVKNLLIRQFTRLYAVNTDEAVVPSGGYRSFNDFFTRALKPGARVVDTAADALTSPCDGTVAERGDLIGHDVTQSKIAAKHRTYPLDEFLGDMDRADVFRDGHFATIYLAPYNYHRVHVPLDSTLVGLHYEPGLLYSVNLTTAALVDALYVKNERLVCHFDSAVGPYALIFVGALNVGSVSLSGVGEVLPRADRRAGSLPLPARCRYARGDELGWFNMGSTVVLVFRAGAVTFAEHFRSSAIVRMGEKIGITAPTP